MARFVNTVAFLPLTLRQGTYTLLDWKRTKNMGMVADCEVDVNMLSYGYGQTQKQTNHGSFRTARQASYRAYQGTVWLSFRCGSDTVGSADGSAWRKCAAGVRRGHSSPCLKAGAFWPLMG
jgi:hypothetical protein